MGSWRIGAVGPSDRGTWYSSASEDAIANGMVMFFSARSKWHPPLEFFAQATGAAAGNWLPGPFVSQ